MDFSNILGKLDNEKLGQIAGFLLAEQKYGKERGVGLFGNIQLQLTNLMRQPHFPDLSHVSYDLTQGWGKTVFMPSLVAGVGGWILDEIDILPAISKIGKLLKTLGFNAAVGCGLTSMLEHATTQFSQGGSGGSSSGGIQNMWGGGR